MATPATGHVGGTVSHLVGHMKQYFFTKNQSDTRYYNTSETVANSDRAAGAVGQLQVGSAAPTSYEYGLSRYVVEAPPASVGVIAPIPVAITSSFCKDVDGCQVTLAMVNWDAAALPGMAASREDRLFISQTSNHWRFSNDIQGNDGASGVQESSFHDCYVGDAETPVATTNGRSDSGVGFGLLNAAGGSYSDSTTTCRVVLED